MKSRLLSDLSIRLKSGAVLKAHKFVLDARSKNWNSHNLSTINELDLCGTLLMFFYPYFMLCFWLMRFCSRCQRGNCI